MFIVLAMEALNTQDEGERRKAAEFHLHPPCPSEEVACKPFHTSCLSFIYVCYLQHWML